jgi:hypothetical protein
MISALPHKKSIIDNVHDSEAKKSSELHTNHCLSGGYPIRIGKLAYIEF